MDNGHVQAQKAPKAKAEALNDMRRAHLPGRGCRQRGYSPLVEARARARARARGGGRDEKYTITEQREALAAKRLEASAVLSRARARSSPAPLDAMCHSLGLHRPPLALDAVVVLGREHKIAENITRLRTRVDQLQSEVAKAKVLLFELVAECGDDDVDMLDVPEVQNATGNLTELRFKMVMLQVSTQAIYATRFSSSWDFVDRLLVGSPTAPS